MHLNREASLAGYRHDIDHCIVPRIGRSDCKR
jgi:hypothetical protein